MEIIELLKEEPILKKEFETLRTFLGDFSQDFSKREFEEKYERYLEFLEFLSEILSIPKREEISEH